MRNKSLSNVARSMDHGEVNATIPEESANHAPIACTKKTHLIGLAVVLVSAVIIVSLSFTVIKRIKTQSTAKSGTTTSIQRTTTANVTSTLITTITRTTVTRETTTVTTTTPTTTTTGLCTPNCINGGNCTGPNTCQCNLNISTGSYCQTPNKILWTFDNHLLDQYGYYPGVGINSPQFSSPGINGYGASLYLQSALSQSVTVYSPPFLDMSYASFSVLVWAKANSLQYSTAGNVDNDILGQEDVHTQDRSLHLVIRNKAMRFGFFNDDLQGNQLLQINQWYHLAYVYDYSTTTVTLYINGVVDASQSGLGPYQGTKGNINIGTSAIYPENNYWDGYLDELSYSPRAKSASEVLREATLTLSYAFENNIVDDGPLGINGIGTNIVYGNVNNTRGMYATFSNSSYIQSVGLVLLGTSRQPYSMAMRIRPSLTTTGTIVHVSSLMNGTGSWCMPMIGFTNDSRIAIQSSNGSVIGLRGPVIVTNQWTHIVMTYGVSRGIRLWINGTQFGTSTGIFYFSGAGSSVTITLGSSLNGGSTCKNNLIATGQYVGDIDAFQLYSRELNATEISTVMNG